MSKWQLKVEFYKDRKGEWRWRAKARNGKILADSAEGYKRRAMCLKAWFLVRPGPLDGSSGNGHYLHLYYY